MESRTIPQTGESLPIIGLGTWQTFDVDLDARARTRLGEVLTTFVDAGGRLVDSSPMYRRSERVVGELAASAGIHDRLFLATKVWTRGRAEGIRQMENSMRLLRTDRLDLMQVHNLVDARIHLDTLRGWKRDGRVRYIGVTHYTAAGAAEIARLIATEPVDFVQINYSAVERAAEEKLLPECRDRGIAVIANRPLGGEGGGLLRALASRPLPALAAEAGCATWAQLLLTFVVSHPAVTCAIPATGDPGHLRDDLRAGDGPIIDEGLRERIATAVR